MGLLMNLDIHPYWEENNMHAFWEIAVAVKMEFRFFLHIFSIAFFAQTCQNRQWKMMAIFVFLLHDAHKSLPILYSLDVKIDWMVHIYYPAYSTNSSEKLHIIFAFTTFFCSSISYDPSNWVSMDIWSFSSIWVPTIHLPSSQQGNVLTENCNCNTV